MILPTIKKLSDDPFRFFFPLGVILSLVAVLFWPIKIFNLGFSETSTKLHGWLQLYGFLFAFVLGFLTTALPRLTQTDNLKPRELMQLIALYLATLGFLFAANFFAAHLCFLATILSLLSVLFPRFLKRKRNPPASFVFIPFAFFSAITGALLTISFLDGKSVLPAEFADLGLVLLVQGFILFLIIGVGGFLVKSILGWGGFTPALETEKIKVPIAKLSDITLHAVVATGILTSFFVETLVHFKIGYLLRALFVSVELLWQLQIHKNPVSGKLSASTLRLSMILLASGFWSMVFFPREYALGYLHLCLAGGFAITTFAVATRVILSHCGYSELLNGKYRPFTVAVSIMFFALATRFYAEFVPNEYYTHLAYAGSLWAIGVLVWSGSILSKCIKTTFT